jgi:hypothetical protein
MSTFLKAVNMKFVELSVLTPYWKAYLGINIEKPTPAKAFRHTPSHSGTGSKKVDCVTLSAWNWSWRLVFILIPTGLTKCRMIQNSLRAHCGLSNAHSLLLLSTVCCAVCTAHYALPTACSPLPTARSLLSAIHYPSLTTSTVYYPPSVHCPLPTVHFTLFLAHCPHFIAYCPQSTTHCRPSTVHCPPPTIHSLLLTVHCSLPMSSVLRPVLGTVWYGSGSLPFQRGNVPKKVLFMHLNLIFLVSRSNRIQPKGILC